MIVQPLRAIDLDQPPVLEDRDAVAHRQRLALVVGDVDDRGADPLVQLAQFDLHRLPQLLVERRQRLVHQDQARLEDHGACQRHALALAAGELGDAARLVARQPDHRERAAYPRSPIRLCNPSRAQRKGDVLADAHMRK